MSWIEHENLRKRFWATLKGEGYTEDEVHDALKVDSVKQYTGTIDEALADVRAYKEEDVSEFTEARFTGTWKGPRGSGEIFVCVRDEDDSKGMERLIALIPFWAEDTSGAGAEQPVAQPDTPQPDMGPTQAAAAEAPEGWCPVHKIQMDERKSKNTGKMYWSHWSAKEGGKPCFGKGFPEEEDDEMPF